MTAPLRLVGAAQAGPRESSAYAGFEDVSAPYDPLPLPGHVLEDSDSSAYYTAPHSRVATSATAASPQTVPRVLSPPPLGYRTQQGANYDDLR